MTLSAVDRAGGPTPAPRHNVIRGPWPARQPMLDSAGRYRRSAGWFVREAITLTVLAAFVVLMVHLAGGAGLLAEHRS